MKLGQLESDEVLLNHCVKTFNPSPDFVDLIAGQKGLWTSCKQNSFVAKRLARRLQEGKQSSGGGPFQTNHSELRFGQRLWSCCDVSNGGICSNHLP